MSVAGPMFRGLSNKRSENLEDKTYSPNILAVRRESPGNLPFERLRVEASRSPISLACTLLHLGHICLRGGANGRRTNQYPCPSLAERAKGRQHRPLAEEQ